MVGGHDLLWQPDATVWDAVAPILFPVVGWTSNASICVDGIRYPMSVHGFAARRHFAVADRGDAHLVLIDSADAETSAMYPFAYRLMLHYDLTDEALSLTATVTNDDAREMPYALGFHPGFRWPKDAAATLTFEKPEAPMVPDITAAGLFASTRRAVPLEGTTLPLTRDLLSREALCFLDIASRGFACEAQSFGRLYLQHDDFPHLAIWSRPPAEYLCLESWTGHGDLDGFAGELRAKPSMRLLAPGEAACHRATYTFTPP